MLSNATDPNLNKDKMTLDLENNPCAICRAMKITARCQGHALGMNIGDGGEGLDLDNNAQVLFFDITVAENEAPRAKDVEGKEVVIPEKDWLKLLQTEFANELTIDSDPIRGKFTLQIKPHLSDSKKEEMEILLSLVKKSCKAFMRSIGYQPKEDYTAQMSPDNQCLEIHIPDTVIYKQFVVRLGHQFLHLHEVARLEQQARYASDREDKVAGKEEINPYKTPSPFGDFKRGPRFRGSHE